MLEFTEPQRESYRSSGKVRWLVFLPGLVVITAFTMVMSLCLYLAFGLGFYLVFIAPIIAALMGAGLWNLILMWSHCRNYRLATTISVLLGLLLYLGYYHVGLMDAFGVQNVHRIDLLPQYILFRMETDVVRDAHDLRPAPAQGPDTVQQIFNWVFFAGELACVIGMFVGVGAQRASKAYCETCRKWMKSETAGLMLGSGASMWRELGQGNFAAAVQQLSNTAPANPMGCNLVVEHCTACHGQSDLSKTYLTLTDVPSPTLGDLSAALKPHPKPKTGVRKIVTQVALLPQEVVALATTFPALQKNIETRPELFAAAQQEVQKIEQAVAVQAQEWPHQYAQIEVLKGPTAKVILTTKNAVIQTVVGIVTIFGGIVLAFVPAGLLFGLMAKPPDWLAAMALVWLFACMILSLGWIMFYPTYFTTRFMKRQSRKAFAARADSAVDWQDPELIFVDIIPRTNWGKQMLENATDIGFLELNKERQELIFEGDRERYWIPADSILDIKHEFFADPVQHEMQSSPSLNHLIVVRAMTETGPWETWFYRRHHTAKPRTAKRRLQDALELESRIRALVQPAGATTTALPTDV